MGLVSRLFGGRGGADSSGGTEAVIVYLGEVELDQFAPLETRLIETIAEGDLGEYDGNEVGPEGATLYMYAPNAEKLFSRIEPVLRADAVSRNCRVIVRRGGPGAAQREVRLAGA